MASLRCAAARAWHSFFGWSTVSRGLHFTTGAGIALNCFAASVTDSLMKTKLVTIDPEVMSGEPVFTGTRVPVRNLIDYLSAGHTLNDFLAGFPGVKRSQAIAFLEQSSNALLEQTGARRKAA